jgi:S1-C subfamily serine protease
MFSMLRIVLMFFVMLAAGASLGGCAAGRKTVLLTKGDVPRSVERVRLEHSVARFESEIILGLSRSGITPDPQGDAPFVLQITTGGTSGYCLINDSVEYSNATYMLKDAESGEAIIAVSKGGWTGPCAYHSGDLFGELAALLVEALKASGTVDLAERWPNGVAGGDRVSGKRRVVGGTGFFVSPDGYLVTADHVIDGAKTITVTMPDGSEVPASVVAASRSTDVALLKLDVSKVQYLEVGDSSKLALADEVYTIGFPAVEILGTSHKYSDGKISSLSGIKGDNAFLQVSVAVQPGNSGGPLVDATGAAVGLVTSTAAVEAFYRMTGSLPQGITWAVKSEYIKAVGSEFLPDRTGLPKSVEDVQAAIVRIIVKH